jgi:hypothetical protein
MQGDPVYAIGKLWRAVDILASGTASLQQRLYDAYLSSLHVLSKRDFPDKLQPDFEVIVAALTWIPVDHEGQGTAASTTDAMSDDEARQVATHIVNLFYEMVNRFPEPMD